MAVSAEQSAAEVVETVPVVMRTIIKHMRAQREGELSIQQFRSLAFVFHEGPCSLSQVAGHLAMNLPAASKLVDGLVERDLVSREGHPEDRRRVVLALTPAGKALWGRARARTQAAVAEVLGACSEAERGVVVEAMQVLRGVFGAEAGGARRVMVKRTPMVSKAPAARRVGRADGALPGVARPGGTEVGGSAGGGSSSGRDSMEQDSSQEFS